MTDPTTQTKNPKLNNLTITKAQELFSDGDFTSVELTEYYLSVIKEKNEDLNAYREVFADVLDHAKKADEERATIAKENNGDKKAWIKTKPLLGMPISLKDNILINGKIAGASSKMLENYVAIYDSTVTKKLRAAGAIFIGRVNMDEFAMGGSTENSAYGVTKNPHDTTRVAGGSSGGSIASVAMDGAIASLGSDTGGSIRQPAAYCGVVGLKPTYGSVSRHGLMAMGSSLDVIGPVTRSVEDAKIIFDIIKGKDKYDATSHDNKSDATNYEIATSEISGHNSGADSGAKPAKKSAKIIIGIIPELLKNEGIDKAVLENFNATIEKLKENGAEIREISLPRISYALATYYIVMPAEVSSNMGRFDGMRYGMKLEGDTLLADYMKTRGELLGKEARRRIMLGTYVLSVGYYDAFYNKANIVREMLREDFKKAFAEVSVIATPTAPTVAFKIGSHTSDPIKMYLEDIFTVPANLVGIPAISIPTGMTSAEKSNHTVVGDSKIGADGSTAASDMEDITPTLPLAIQFMAPHGGEEVLFEVSSLI